MKQRPHNLKVLDKSNRSIALISLSLGLLALVENSIGQFSDIRGMYVIHLNDGQHQWPLSYHTLLGADTETQPLEYPALTGLIVWLLSFAVTSSEDAKLHYYWISAVINSFLFAFSSLQVKSIAGKKAAYLFIFSIAVVYSLHRNWDIWAVVAMLFAVLYYEKEKFYLSALWLSIATALKFFPIVLLLPILIISIKSKRYLEFFRYFGFTLASWVAINLPFALIDLKGWFYFYKFSFEREIGSGSFFEALWRLGLDFKVPDFVFYSINIFLFIVTSYFMSRINTKVNLAQLTFFSLFAFTLFNKQYSMQYIIWLTPFAVISILSLNRSHQSRALKLFVVWQISELFFHYFFFNHILTYTGKNNGLLLTNFEVSDSMYGVVTILRYFCLVIFTTYLVVGFCRGKIYENPKRKNK